MSRKILLWWENAYNHQLKSYSKANSHPNEASHLLTFNHEYESENVNSWKHLVNYDYDSFLNYSVVSSYDNENSEERAIPSFIILFMAISYGVVVFGGVLGNASLFLTLCSASAVRLRNPLLLAVCFADLLVTGISAPITLLNLAITRRTTLVPIEACRVIHFIQIMPVAASTISFFLLSLDRYATVKHPRLSQLRQRRYLHATLAVISWLTSAAICAPFLFTYHLISKPVLLRDHKVNHMNLNTGNNNNIGSRYSLNYKATTTEPTFLYKPTAKNLEDMRQTCTFDAAASSIFVSFIFFHTIAVFVLPGIGVLLNHYGVRKKLCELSLIARAAHGELPLPMPILRRQTHIVVVAGIGSAQKASPKTEDSSSVGRVPKNDLDPYVQDFDRTIKTSNPISPRAMREFRAHSQRQRVGNSQRRRGPITPGIPLPKTSTLRSRRHLANMLVASAFIFIVCWAPHVFCIFYKNLGYKQYCTKTSLYFNLLLGYMYSAISPAIYWALNHNSLKQSPCAPLTRLRSMQKFLRSRFRSHTVPAPSSTNEAALGAFNPKLIKLTPKQYRAQASSHYLY